MSEETHLYRQIAEALRQQILHGELLPGARLPTLRAMTARWGCTQGTVQRAYQLLVAQGLVTSRAGQGTRVASHPPLAEAAPLRRAALVHRAEAYLLEAVSAGYEPGEAEVALRQALERWQVASRQPFPAGGGALRFSGSHDLAVAWLAAHYDGALAGVSMQVSFSGSMGGLLALAEGRADLCGCHLWDEETDLYNLPTVRRIFPGERLPLMTLALRRIGLILPPGNPQQVGGLEDLARPGLRFANRQPGSGTRVWLDAALRRISLPAAGIDGYHDEKMTHSEVAQSVAEGRADCGLGLEAAARPYGLDFIPLTLERYDLVIHPQQWEHPALQALRAWLVSAAGRNALAWLAGYDFSRAGEVSWTL
ncbi:MAG: GntR family transcriptional regulator [Chloroflexi bacterium]|nr:GntR family transcriptional regulator [Chloroflexota bacterium]